MTGFARRCWSCHAAYTLEEFRKLPHPSHGERQEVTNSPTLILRQCETPGCDNTLAIDESQVYPPDTGADVVDLSAVRKAKAQTDKPRIHVGTGAGPHIGYVWLTGEGGGEDASWDVINDNLGWWLSPNDAEALAGMLKGAAAKARPAPPAPGLQRLTVRSQLFEFPGGPIPMPGEEGHTVRFNFQTGECEVVEPKDDKEEP